MASITGTERQSRARTDSTMPIYLTADRLKLAVDRLRESRAGSGMINFLILKRALALGPPDGYVRFSTKDKYLQKAIDELTLWTPKDVENDRPFVNIFGTINSKTKGTMSKKYRSNGPGDTLRNLPWQTVIETKQGEESLAAKLTDAYRTDLARQTLVQDKKRPMPRLSDAAVWYHRGQDIAGLITKSQKADDIEKILAENFCKQLKLDEADVAILFATETIDA